MRNNFFMCFSSHLTKDERSLLGKLIDDFHKEKELAYNIEEIPMVKIKGSYLNFIERFQKKSIRLYRGDTVTTLNFISSVKFDEYSKVVFTLNDELKKYLLDERSKVEYNLKAVLNFKYEVTILFFYRVIQENIERGSLIIELDKLKELLEVKEYKRYYDFERHILKNIAEDLRERSSYRLDYLKVKEGNRVKQLKFTVKNNKLDQLRAKSKSILYLIRNKVNNKEEFQRLIYNTLLYNDYAIVRSRVVDVLKVLKHKDDNFEKVLKISLEGEAIEETSLVRERVVKVKNRAEFQKAIFNELSGLLYIREIGSMDYNTKITKVIYDLDEGSKVEIAGSEVDMELCFNTIDESSIKIWQKRLKY